jgi:hypothetical protein
MATRLAMIQERAVGLVEGLEGAARFIALISLLLAKA